MQLSDAGLNVLKEYEALRLTPYLCSSGTWTNGWGHTKGVTADTPRITNEEAELNLREDVAEFEDAVDEYVLVDLRQNQFDALVCFAFNIGIRAFKTSTLVKKLNQRDYLGAVMEFQRWSLVDKVRSKGLLRRRFKTASLFLE